jgi:glycosyltransferase involved in cell wall biosynthesis
VNFGGVVSNVNYQYAQSDGFVLISSWEGFSNSMIEAGAAGLPMVLTPVSGVVELFDDSLEEWIVPIRDEEITAKMMMKVMNLSIDERISLANQVKTNVNNRCDIDYVFTKWEDLCQRLFFLKKGEKSGE